MTVSKNTPFCVLLQRSDASRVFVLVNDKAPGGRFLQLLCLSPRPAADDELKYDMVFRKVDPKTSYLTLSSTVTYKRTLVVANPVDSINVLDAFWAASSGNVWVPVRLPVAGGA